MERIEYNLSGKPELLPGIYMRPSSSPISHNPQLITYLGKGWYKVTQWVGDKWTFFGIMTEQEVIDDTKNGSLQGIPATGWEKK